MESEVGNSSSYEDHPLLMLQLLAIFFLLLVITGILSSAMLGGFNFSAEAMGFKFSKLN